MIHTRMQRTTKIYNRFHDPKERSANIQCFRDRQIEMDEAVRDAYGWSDLKLDFSFIETDRGKMFIVSQKVRQEMFNRLLALNHERYAEEVRQGLHEEKPGKKGGGKRGGGKAGGLVSIMDGDDEQEEE